MKPACLLTATLLGFAPAAMAQTSSLYLPIEPASPPPGAQPPPLDEAHVRTPLGPRARLSPEIARASLSAVVLPEPRRYAMNDLVTIIVRESSATAFSATMSTEKGVEFEGELGEFPDPRALLNFQLRPSEFSEGRPELEIGYEQGFDGDGEYARRDSMTARLTAKVVDIKPNGNLVLEARKYVQADDESLVIVVTGTCRVEDISADNTVLSTELYDLHVNKQHEGELDETTQKGLITEVLEGLFAF